MQHCHQGIKHFRRDSFVDVFILFIIHVFAITSCNSTFEYLFSELLYLLLVSNSVLVINILSLFILIQTFMGIFSLLNNTYSLITWRSNIVEVINSLIVKHVLNILDLYITVKRHVRHHDSNVFWGNVAITIEIIPIHQIQLVIGYQNKKDIIERKFCNTYISKVNFIFWSKSPINIYVKFFMNKVSVTYSSFFLV